jgi:hypothetical protein
MLSILNRNPKIPLLHFEIPTVKGWVFRVFGQFLLELTA